MKKRIFYHDTDAGGVVYYGRYLNYLEESRTEFLEKKKMNVGMFHDRGLIFAVRKCSITYLSPARYGDTVICEAELLKITAAQLVFFQKIFNKTTGIPAVEAEVSLVCLNRNFKPVQIPDDLRAKLSSD